MDDQEYLRFFTDFKKFPTSRTFDNRKRKKEPKVTRTPLSNGARRHSEIAANSDDANKRLTPSSAVTLEKRYINIELVGWVHFFGEFFVLNLNKVLFFH